MRYCSGRGIEPRAVDETALDEYFAYRKQTTSLATNIAARRSVARAWNAGVEASANWPQQRLSEPPLKSADGPAWEDFPEGLRRDVGDYLASLRTVRKGSNGKRYRPCSPKTIKTRRAELVAFARKAVKVGISIDSLFSLAALVHPQVVERVIDAYWREDGEEPKIFTIELASKILALARRAGLGRAAIECLEEIRATLEEYRRGGLTDKNQAVVRKVLTPGVWKGVVNLPQQLMREAGADLPHAPIKAALTAQIAVAIAILSFAPIRLGNLVAIRIDENLIKPGGPGSLFWLTFPHYEVKNRMRLEFTFDEETTALIEQYIHDFRPHLLRGQTPLTFFLAWTGSRRRQACSAARLPTGWKSQPACGSRLTNFGTPLQRSICGTILGPTKSLSACSDTETSRPPSISTVGSRPPRPIRSSAKSFVDRSGSRRTPSGTDDLQHTCIPTEAVYDPIPSLRLVAISGLRGMDCRMPSQPKAQARRSRRSYEATHAGRSQATVRLLSGLPGSVRFTRPHLGRRRPGHPQKRRQVH
jgi:hypothetical protein